MERHLTLADDRQDDRVELDGPGYRDQGEFFLGCGLGLFALRLLAQQEPPGGAAATTQNQHNNEKDRQFFHNQAKPFEQRAQRARPAMVLVDFW